MEANRRTKSSSSTFDSHERDSRKCFKTQLKHTSGNINFNFFYTGKCSSKQEDQEVLMNQFSRRKISFLFHMGLCKT